MKKYLAAFLCMIMCLTTIAGCKSSPSTDGTPAGIRISSLKGPTSMGLVKLYEDYEEYEETIEATGDTITAGLLKGDIDIATLPCNAASVLYNKSEGKIKIAAVNTLGVLYILTKNDTVTSVSDLKGKTIYTTGQGTTPEYTLRYLLSSNGIDPDKDVTIDFSLEATEAVSKVSALNSAVLMLPEPFATVAASSDSSIEYALDVNEEWMKITGDMPVVTGVVVVNAEFAEANKEAVATFLDRYRESVAYADENPSGAAALIEKYDIVKESVALKALKNCNIKYMDGTEMEQAVSSYLQILHDYNPASIGGTLPTSDIFYQK